MKNALINPSGVVENIIELDSDNDWLPPEGYTIIPSDVATIGDSYAQGVFKPSASSDQVTAYIETSILGAFSKLDVYIPRGLEDYWTLVKFDVTTLPAIQQQRLAKKQSLRKQFSEL